MFITYLTQSTTGRPTLEIVQHPKGAATRSKAALTLCVRRRRQEPPMEKRIELERRGKDPSQVKFHQDPIQRLLNLQLQRLRCSRLWIAFCKVM
jgi:hypothetical protein